MFIVFLHFSENRDRAGAFLDAHKAWLKQGFDDGVFLLAGSLKPQAGGAVLAQDTDIDALTARVEADPFVTEGIVRPEILEMTPSLAEPRLSFLKT